MEKIFMALYMIIVIRLKPVMALMLKQKYMSLVRINYNHQQHFN